jgi:hypothetical protein
MPATEYGTWKATAAPVNSGKYADVDGEPVPDGAGAGVPVG